MKKIIMFLCMFSLYKEVYASDKFMPVFAFVDSDYIEKLTDCTPMQNIKTFHFGEEKINLQQKIIGIDENNLCDFSIGIVEEYLLHCRIPQNKIKIIINYLQNSEQTATEFDELISDINYCQIQSTEQTATFKDNIGIEYSCNVVMNVQMVSDKECRNCRNRTLVEDDKIKLAGKPLTYCVLKFCPIGYIKELNGKCIMQD